MSIVDLIGHPITRALWDGVKYTAPRVVNAWHSKHMPRSTTEYDVQQAASETAEPIFDESEVYYGKPLQGNRRLPRSS